ncbi:Vacuolar protein sorting/targeting protein 10 [Penicillium diatomitis]|uniref:Vacuolar protein sorting/targeting protein 10 n=1 Tax=Penicillium diatomitis TaxID=2819901 RepID=A0A9X0BYM9_9EURO|nr:Vacuolar protein sorting/targeting protein 10 [Penicillium diatomitis]KAJ5489553.1 Vacuolar protein sorting/targeting protein 10 [Penicillium diatomitis]
MIPRWLLLVVGLLLAWTAQPATAKSDKPKLSSETLNHAPYDLFWFKGSETVLYRDPKKHTAHVSFDGGAKWETVKGPDGKMEGAVALVWEHPHDPNRAYILGAKGQHWITTDRAKTWKAFEIPARPIVEMGILPLAFNGWDEKKVIFMGSDCSGLLGCVPKAWYTTDDFKTVHTLQEFFYSCMWAAGAPQFGQDLDLPDKIGDRILCVVPGSKPGSHTQRLIASDEYFKDGIDGFEVNLDRGRPVTGSQVIARSVKKYLVVGVVSTGTTEQALFVSDDSREWHRAEFGGHRIEQDAYTVLESTNYSIQVDVQTTQHKNSVGALFSSNSNGTYFTPNIEHTNRDDFGFVDFEKVSNIQGIVIVNTVKNWEEVEKSEKTEKKLVSGISFDDGRTFQPLKSDGEKLHLHSMTSYDQLNELPVGHMFSSPAPGIVMGVGNTGEHLKKYSDGDLYVSDDAGLTWRRALKGPHQFAFGDQGGVIIAISDDGKTDKVKYSLNHGKDWEDDIELEHKIKPVSIITTPEATSLKFLIVGVSSDKKKAIISSIDFDGLHERKCDKDDLESWWALLDEDRKPKCLMGHKQKFTRRKADAECFIKEDKLDAPIFEPCDCTKDDFECDYNFKRNEKNECVPAVPLTPPPGECKDKSDKYKGPSGWRLIPGNNCNRVDGHNYDDKIERSCEDTVGAPSGGGGGSGGGSKGDGKVHAGKAHEFAGTNLDYFYLERQTSNSGDDETIFLLSGKNEVFVTHDHAKTWDQPKDLKGVEIVGIVQHPHYTDGAYFLTAGKTAYSTINRGDTFNKFELPTSVSNRDKGGLNPLAFHKKYMDWMIWMGNDDCKNSDCVPNAYFTKNRGADWEGPDLRGVGSCIFAYSEKRENSTDLILCEQYEKESKKNNRQLVSSDSHVDRFSEPKVINDNIAHFVTMDDYIVVATYHTDDHKFLNVSTSLDGRVFAQANFPVNVDVSQYTVLPGSTDALFLFVQLSNEKERSYGQLVKSNSNGTYFVSSLPAVNVDDRGYSDFEKIANLEGVALANVVANVDEVRTKKDSKKKLRSVITHNDGGQWSFLPPPTKDAEGKKFGCSVTEGKGTETCALHIHGYTERRDWRDTFYSGSAIGVIVGVGNVGPHLSSVDSDDVGTFISNDGGISWTQAKKGRYMFEFGDAGSVIVLVREAEPTKVVFYSLDEGKTWTEFQFSDTEVLILDISTVPSDTSKSFVLWVREPKSSNRFATIPIDFSGIWDRECTPPDGKDASDDFYLWTPKHPSSDDNCVFGHIEQYHRKRPEKECWVNWRDPHVHRVESANCTCTRADFECDYNYEIQSDGSCGLVPGFQPPDHSLSCKDNPDQVEYWEPTGYRRIPQSTCKGGLELDKIEPRPCPNKEEEFERKHGISGIGLFFAIVIPIVAASAFGYFVYTRWDGKFGQIRLGESGGLGGGGSSGLAGLFTRDSLLVAIPVTIIAGAVAVAQALPLLAMSLWRSASGFVRTRGRGYQRPYATRSSFASRRGDYTHVVDDEDELLGVDDLEDDEEA